MATKPPSGQLRPTSEADVRQSILDQAQAAAAAQDDPAQPRRPEALLQEADLVTPDAVEDDEAPPAYYGGVYGEIHNEKDGWGTSARVTDDGRVNIRINQFNRRLSQVFTPVLRQQAQQTTQETGDHRPSTHGLEEATDTSPPPALNIVIQVVGSRGDVQPFVALGKVLRETYGHRVRLATHPVFKDFVEENGLEFFSIGGDPSRLMAFMVNNPGLIPSFRSLSNGDVRARRRDVGEYLQGCWRSCYEAGDGTRIHATGDDISEVSGYDSGSESTARPFVADCIIANPPSFAHIHCAEKLGIPLHIMFTMPYSPTQAFPHPLANIQSSNADPQLTNFISYAMIELLTWQGLGDVINRFRNKCLRLDPVSVFSGPGMLQRLRVPHTYCWSPALIPKPNDWGAHVSISGYYKLASDEYTPAPELQAFLNNGPPPVYIGFGSIVLENPNALTELIFQAVRKTGQRVLLSQGWGGLGADELSRTAPDGVFMLGNVPHDWLFKHVSCVVHHGGAGTTAAGITAGRPTVIVPFFGDQPFWGGVIARAGAGPQPIPHKRLTSDKLADAITFCLRPESLARAQELASKIAAERGSETGAQLFHQHLNVDRLRCTLAPSRPAVWRIKRTKVRLSAFAACTLANANLLDFHDLKLFRAREWSIDEGPVDPISGGFTAALGAFGGMAMGLAEVPSETFKALQTPSTSRSVPDQSQTSVPAATMSKETLSIDVPEGSTAPTSSGRGRPSLDRQESTASGLSLSDLSVLSSPTSNTPPGSQVNTLQHELSRRPRGVARDGVRSRVESAAGLDRDMLRHTGVHTSKGVGRFAKALVQSPMDLSVSFTKGFHNVPKLWGDDTVRPQERVTGLKSGLVAVGREFGFGFYDGITGLVTQPMNGMQKEGVSGLLKGVGKGIGGLVAKPGAAMFGVLGHTMKGIHKEVQKSFGKSVQSYVAASRAAQGYEEWLQSGEREREDVIERWRLIQKYLKKSHNNEKMMVDALEAQRRRNLANDATRQQDGRPASATQPPNSTDAVAGGYGNAMPTTDFSGSSLRPAATAAQGSLGAFEANEPIRSSFQGMSPDGAEEAEDANVFRAIRENVSQLQRQRQAASDPEAAQGTVRETMAPSHAENQRSSSEALDSSEWESQISLTNEEGEDSEYEHAVERPGTAAATASGSTGVQRPPAYDSGHLAGTTQSEFEAQRQGQEGEKTAQEKMEEDIVMEYVKKQSLLEASHQHKRKSRATTTEPTEDEDLQKALELSMQGHGQDAEVHGGEASRM
ncbi:glycosyltransferase family 1 protein [Baudoinia panamericana UAMH 10762]|uniref:Glycosyltransferase family 1 protein n=1 Tax=Baudoinia panamericana (strain UAMH 10762) TaxID=717646 RepID=M2N5Y0_BAUPA|nr:glycosyltransferase family 1 protein [Baudoinia panamericana UAMH 10762]EMC99433.1 glycosyltransferase family 1 protein [Baudoinia panamericana UAMH 10762]